MQNKLLKGLGSVGELVEEIRECHFESIEADVSCRSIQAHIGSFSVNVEEY